MSPSAPEPVAARLAAFAVALTDPDRPVPEGLLGRRGTRDEARFAVYRNNVVASLVDALAVRFPVTLALVGDAFFRAAARLYVAAEPPRSRVLARYGTGFPAFLDGFPPAQTVPYLGDVARLEVALGEAHDAADAPALDLAALAAIDADELISRHLPLHPAMRLVGSRFAVVALHNAHHGAAPSAPELAGAQDALVTRPADEVQLVALPPGGGRFMAALIAGATLAGAAEAAEVDEAFDFGTVLVAAVAAGAFAALAPSPPEKLP